MANVAKHLNVSGEFDGPSKCFTGIGIMPGSEVGVKNFLPSIQKMLASEPNNERFNDAQYSANNKLPDDFTQL